MKAFYRVLLTVTAMLACVFQLAAQLPYMDKTLSAEERAADLVGRLTLEEKSLLIRYNSPAIPRLGIPAYNWWNEALHGVARNGLATVYPMPIGMAATFDEQLLEEVFTSVSDEARVKYRLARTVEAPGDYWYKGLTFWTPNINIFRDPRWGRGMETYGEDPYLTGLLGMAVVRGLQGDREDGHLKAQACAKHFAVHSGPESSRHRFDAVVSERDLWETYLPAFKDLVTKAKVDEVMFAYNSFEGTPCGANKRLLQDILRDEWGFKGIILSDCWAVSDFYGENNHNWSKDAVEAIAAAVHAGMELECGALTHLIPQAVERGLMKETDLDEAVKKLFTVRFALGEMDFESPWDSIPESVLASEEHRLQALDAARKSLVLLKNDGILPLKAGARIALVGPNAADSVMMWGNYNGFPTRTVTLLDALKARIPDLEYVKGCPLAAELQEEPTDIAAIVSGLSDYDTVIFAGGISPRLEGEQMDDVNIPGFFGGDRTSISLPAIQKQLIAALAEAGKKVIFINFSGSTIALSDEDRLCSAIVQAWYPGQEGGTAVADLLFGDFNPSGRLPLTFYADDSQLKDFNDYDMEGRTYRYFKGKPLYPFGHGLSYTTFKYGRPKVRTLADGTRAVVVKVKNKGKVDGDEIVQLYVSRPDDQEGPVKTLRGVKRITLKARKSMKVAIPISDDTFTWWNPDSGRMEPRGGRYLIHVGGTSADSGQRTVKTNVQI
ncbi:MAG: glycoside hydrolase family 3 C-terminal domain-containing protein [Bacteroidales bacterium]|nr:glycoside hydrolase family 3 C-terminal domain-containing protein [Bacteroidales bacterium]